MAIINGTPGQNNNLVGTNSADTITGDASINVDLGADSADSLVVTFENAISFNQNGDIINVEAGDTLTLILSRTLSMWTAPPKTTSLLAVTSRTLSTAAPKDEAELQRMLVTGVNYTKSAIAMRYPRGNGVGAPLMEEGWDELEIGKGEILRSGDDVLLVGYGSMVYPALQTAEILSEHGVEATVVNARFVKPLDMDLIGPLAQRIGKVVTLEEACIMGGFGSAVAEALLDRNILAAVKRLGVPDILVDHAEPKESFADLGLTPAQMADAILASFFHQRAVIGAGI
jgi:hypothetical protein